jgi:RpiB/LacA/LacB family sugar-phosphate isomerase
MRVAVASDHAGFDLKRQLIPVIAELGHDVLDVGAFQPNPTDDYPDFAEAIGRAVLDDRADRGVLICGSGVGACVAANKLRGIRAGLCHDQYSAHQGVEHDNMNILVFGSRVIGVELAKDLVHDFLGAIFTGEERHARRLAKIAALEGKLQ